MPQPPVGRYIHNRLQATILSRSWRQLEPHRGDITQPWVSTHGNVTYHTEPHSGDITQPWLTTHGDITQPWVTTHGFITAARLQINCKRSVMPCLFLNKSSFQFKHDIK